MFNVFRCVGSVNAFRCSLTVFVFAGMVPGMIVPEQSRAARGLLDWSQDDLARAAHLGQSTVRDFEKGRRVPSHNNLQAIRLALEEAGVTFIAEDTAGPGVRLTRPRNEG